MGVSCSKTLPDNDPPEIPPNQLWRHEKCTIRAPHQLTILIEAKSCDYCRITQKIVRKTFYRCEACQLNFCFEESF